MECPICLEEKKSVFKNPCGHTWCKQCHNILIKTHTNCVICRSDIILPMKARKQSYYIEWLLSGGEPAMRWRPKRYRKGQFLQYKY